MASRSDLAFQRDFFTALGKELALPRAIATELPPGVVATTRTDGDNAFIFLQNYSAQNHTLTLPQGYWDLPDRRGGIGSATLSGMGLPYSPSSRVILLLRTCSDEQAFLS